MNEIIKAIFSAPIATLLIVAGVGFLAIAVLGKISNIIEAGKTGRLASAAIGIALLLIGLNISLKSPSPSPVPSPSSGVTASPMPSSPLTQSSITPSPTVEINHCLQQFLQGIPRDRIATVESGAQDVEVIRPDQPIVVPNLKALLDDGMNQAGTGTSPNLR